jgi:hypothetical protein
MMANSRTGTRRSAIASSLALGAVLALATSVGATHLDEACTAFVRAEGGEPAASATVAVGESLEVHGWFPSGENGEHAPPVFVRLEKDGVEQAVFTDVETDEHDEILLVIEFEPGDEGQWTVTAGGENTGCGGSAEVTVIGAPEATPAPGVLPDAASPATSEGWLPLVLGAAALSLTVLGFAGMRRRASDR